MYITLQFIPAIMGCLLTFSLGSKPHTKLLALNRIVTTLSLAVSVFVCIDFFMTEATGEFTQLWQLELDILSSIGASLDVSMTGFSMLMCLLTSLSFFVASFLPIPQEALKKSSTYFGLLLLCQFSLYGVFTSNDAFFFYLFWELTLIPIYFLSSFFGGHHRIRVTFSFFIYTFLASVLLLVAFIYVYSLSNTGSFSYEELMNSNLRETHNAQLIFWLMFIAFSVKTPIFPFHSWQAQLYSSSPTPLTMILSSVVAKMGLFGMFRWLLPLFGFELTDFAELPQIIIFIATASVLFGAVVALQQKNIKTLLAYSSLSHLSLMMLGLFSSSVLATQGALFQMFLHGIVNIALWMMVAHIEKIQGDLGLENVSGLIYKNPILSYAFIFFLLANIALPLTGNFVGEWAILGGMFQSSFLSFNTSLIVVSIAGLSVILGAVYSLRCIQKMIFGVAMESPSLSLNSVEIGIIVALATLVLAMGIYPACWFDILLAEVESIFTNIQSLTY